MFFAVWTEAHWHTIVEIVDEFPIDVGDLIWWLDDTGLGHEPYRNRTKSISAEVYVQNHDVHPRYMWNQLLLNPGDQIEF